LKNKACKQSPFCFSGENQMLDPVIKSTFLALVVAILTAVVKRFLPDLPISEELINSVALIIVSWIVALLGYEGVLRSAVGKRLQSRGLLPK
jgi:hypothetical protein